MQHPTILFDGVCNLCNGSVQWIIARDPAAVFRFAALQSEAGQVLLDRFGFSQEKFDSIVLVDGERVFTRSDAALEIARLLPGGWRFLAVLKILPRFLRNAVYDLIARNRYRWFGKKDQCWVPTPDLKRRFL